MAIDDNSNIEIKNLADSHLFPTFPTSLTPDASIGSEYTLNEAAVTDVLHLFGVPRDAPIQIVGALENGKHPLKTTSDGSVTYHISALTEPPVEKRLNIGPTMRLQMTNRAVISGLHRAATDYQDRLSGKQYELPILTKEEKSKVLTGLGSVGFFATVGYFTWEGAQQALGELAAAPSVGTLGLVTIYAACQRIKGTNERLRRRAESKQHDTTAATNNLIYDVARKRSVAITRGDS